MDRHELDPRDVDAKLRETFHRNAPPDSEAHLAAALRPEALSPQAVSPEAQGPTAGGPRAAADGGTATVRTPKRTPRRRALRLATITASILVLAAAVGVAGWQAAIHLSGDQQVVVITDQPTTTTAPAQAVSLEDGAWIFRADRQADLEKVQLPSDQLAETDYHPIDEAPDVDVVVSDDGQKVTIYGRTAQDRTPVEGVRASDKDGTVTYDLQTGTGGRFVVWAGSGGLQAELTAYGSGRPIVSSLRGALLMVTGVSPTVEQTSTTTAAPAGDPAAQAAAQGAPDLLAAYSTTYEGDRARQQNVRVATGHASGVLLQPDQEYDLDQRLGPRTRERGYSLALDVVGPTPMGPDPVLGGALGQVATTLFNAALEAGLWITQRDNNSIYITHFPKGRDAAIAAGTKNLRFVNDTGHVVWISGQSDGVTTTFRIYGTDDGRKVDISAGEFYNIVPKTTTTEIDDTMAPGESRIVNTGQDGRELDVRRTVTLPDGTVIREDTFHSVWPMIPAEEYVGPSTGATGG